ncbi:MAG TPA: hypothetical protein VFA59_19880 [Vicinamibacterales bacterium]|nr:hypothetical protein [Vicinamibacterales bacterium]
MMHSNHGDKIDEIASDLDDLKTTVEELADDPDAARERPALARLKHELDGAADAADELEQEEEEES